MEKKHNVKVYNACGRCTYDVYFTTAEKAHNDFLETVRSAEKFYQESGMKFTVCRYNDNLLMCRREIG